MTWISYDHMIQHFNFKKLAGADQITSDFDVRVRRRGLAAGMVMHNHDCRCCSNEGATKDFAGMHQDRIQCAD